MKFSTFAVAAVAIAASSVQGFSAPKIAGARVAQVCIGIVLRRKLFDERK